jgi:hypothetical protein
MKRLAIKDFGPLSEAVVELGKLNLIIGMQSSGKSCVMMIACYCSWVEKRIVLRQSATEFEQGTEFIDMLERYYHCTGYVKSDTYIEYESPYMTFSYDNSTKSFKHEWKRNHWRYKRPKVSYIPAERNLISLITNWNKFETSYESILDFKSDLDISRRYVKHESDILGTGISYEFDETIGNEAIVTNDNHKLELINSSSGVQSLIPLFIHLDYLREGIYKDSDVERSYSKKQFENNLLNILYKNYNKKSKNVGGSTRTIHIGGKDYVFNNDQQAEKFEQRAGSLLHTDHVEVFLEEPESNLFPITQFQLVNWILDIAYDKEHDNNFFFIATHSPYILSAILQEKIKDFKLFITYSTNNGLYGIKGMDEQSIKEIYSNGSDAYFNLEVFTK